MNFKKNKLLLFIIIVIILLELVSVVYTIYFYNNLKKDGNYKLYKDIVYDNNKSIIDKQYVSLDIYTPKVETSKKLPVMIFVHGGAWSRMFGGKDNRDRYIVRGRYYTDKNFILVNVNYRSDPSVQYPVPVYDVAKSISWVYNNISKYGGDNNKLFIQGHSAGAQIVSLIITDREFLNKYNLDLNNIKGAILLEGIGYNLLLAKNMGLDNKVLSLYYKLPFGDYNELEKASSINYITSGKHIPPTILFSVDDSLFRIGKTEAKDFYNKLLENGYYAEYYNIPDRGHMSLNSNFGEKDDLATNLASKFIDGLLNK